MEFAFSLGYVSLCKKQYYAPLLLLTICKLSYFIGCRCLDLKSTRRDLRVTSHTRLKACGRCILRFLIGRKAKIVQVHFTLEGEGPKEIILDEKFTWNPTWTINNASWSMRICIKFTSKRPCQWHGLWMRIKGPHNHMVKAFGSCVKWPLHGKLPKV